MSGKHARLSASSAYRWLVCAGGTGSGKAGIAAAEGTFAHSIAAKCLEDPSVTPFDFFCRQEVVDGFTVECTLEMIQAILVYLDEIEEDRQPGDIEWVEMPLLAELRTIDKDLGGTSDHVRYRPSTKTLRVRDFKHGSGTYVEVEDNPQGKLYALGALLTVLKAGHLVETVEVEIIQPRYEAAAPVRRWSFAAVELLDFIADVQEAAMRSREKNPPLVAGDHCDWCPNAKDCPELTKRRHAVALAQFDAVTPYDPAKLAQALIDAPLAEVQIKALKEFAYAEALRGVVIPGFKLVDKIARRKWKSEGEVILWAQSAAIDPYAPREVLSPAQLEEKVKAAAPRGKKKEAVKVLEPLYEKVSSGTALVPVSDDRQPAKVISAEDFPALAG